MMEAKMTTFGAHLAKYEVSLRIVFKSTAVDLNTAVTVFSSDNLV